MDHLPFAGVTAPAVGILTVMKKQPTARPKQNNSRRSNGRGRLRARRINGSQTSNFLQSAAVSVQELQGSSVPTLTGASSRNGDLRVRIQHREFVADIAGSVAYAVSGYPINPGLSVTFPWLSNIAQNFESYQFNGLMFQYRNATTTSSVGKVLYSVDWDAADSAPSSKQQQLQERTKADGAAWMNFDLRCDKADLLKFGTQRYVRSAALAANLDIKTYDVGNLWLGTQAQANTNDIGELWVIYDIELITPNSIEPSPLPSLLSESITGAGGSISVTNIFGAVPVLVGGAVATAAANTITFIEPGQYLLSNLMDGTGITAHSVNTGTATSVDNVFVRNSTTSILEHSLVTVGAANQTVIITPSATTITSCFVQIAPYTVANG